MRGSHSAVAAAGTPGFESSGLHRVRGPEKAAKSPERFCSKVNQVKIPVAVQYDCCTARRKEASVSRRLSQLVVRYERTPTHNNGSDVQRTSQLRASGNTALTATLHSTPQRQFGRQREAKQHNQRFDTGSSEGEERPRCSLPRSCRSLS